MKKIVFLLSILTSLISQAQISVPVIEPINVRTPRSYNVDLFYDPLKGLRLKKSDGTYDGFASQAQLDQKLTQVSDTLTMKSIGQSAVIGLHVRYEGSDWVVENGTKASNGSSIISINSGKYWKREPSSFASVGGDSTLIIVNQKVLSDVGDGVLNAKNTTGTEVYTTRTFVSTVEMRTLNPRIGLRYKLDETGREGEFKYDPFDTTSPDDSSMVIITGTGKRLKRVTDFIFPEIFGAKGDGVTNDSKAIQAAINYVNRMGKGVVYFKEKTYIAFGLRVKKNVNLFGVPNIPANALSETSGTHIKAPFGEAIDFVLSFEPDYTYTPQKGEESGLNKSAPNSSIQNIWFDGSNTAMNTVVSKEAWSVSFVNNKFTGARRYGLDVFDDNNINIKLNVISKLHTNSTADYNQDDNELIGDDYFSAYTAVDNFVGTSKGNKIYYGPSVPVTFNVKSVSSGGLFTIAPFNVSNLRSNPAWATSGVNNGTVAFNESSQTLTVTLTNPSSTANSYRASATNYIQAIRGKTYRITGTAVLMGGSASRVLKLTTGNEQQTYYTTTLIMGSPQNIDVTVTFNPTNVITTPLKIVFDTRNGASGNDVIVLTNLKVFSTIPDQFEKTPLVFEWDQEPAYEFRNKFLNSQAYYPKFITDSTLYLYNDYAGYNANNIINPLSAVTLSSVRLRVPYGVMSVIGRTSAAYTYGDTKIEDVTNTGLLMVGSSLNTFNNMTIMKGNYTATPTLIKLQGGSSENTFNGNQIINRSMINLMDKSFDLVVIDQFSGRNKFYGNIISGGKNLDIVDSFQGSVSNQNQYDVSTMESSTIYRARNKNYKFDKTALNISAGKSTNAILNSGLITGEEFTLYFNDVIFKDSTASAVLYHQSDGSGTQAGRLTIKRDPDRRLYVTVGATVAYSSSGTVNNNIPVDIAVRRLADYSYQFFVNGRLISGNPASVLADAPVGGSTRSFVGSSIAGNANYSIGRFRYFNDALSETEIATLFSSGVDSKEVGALRLNSLTLGTSLVTATEGASVSASGGGVQGQKIDVVLANNSHLVSIRGVSGARSDMLRASFYVRADAGSKGMVLSRGGLDYYLPITTTWTKKVINLKPSFRTITVDTTEALALSFGNEAGGTFGGVYNKSSSGTINIDNFRVWINNNPCATDLDFSKINSSVFVNPLNPSESWGIYSSSVQKYETTVTYNAGALTAGAESTQTLTVTGASVGQPVSAWFLTDTSDAKIIAAKVIASNSVKIWFSGTGTPTGQIFVRVSN